MNVQPVSKTISIPSEGNHTDQPRIFCGQPSSSTNGHQCQVSGCRNELDGLHRGRMLGSSVGQRRGILRASPPTTTSCCILRLGNPARGKAKDPDRAKEKSQSGLQDQKRRARQNQLWTLLPRRVSNTCGRTKDDGHLASETTARVCEDADNGRGERKTGGRKGPISPQNGGAHARTPK